MAEERPGGGEPTEPPSDKKLRDSRRRADVARSPEIPAGAVFLAVFGLLVGIWPTLMSELREYLDGALRTAATGAVSPHAALWLAMKTFSVLALPVAGVALLAGLISNYAQVGSIFSFEPLKPSLNKINPVKNASQVFGKKAGVQLIKAILKVSVIGTIVMVTLWQHAPEVARLVGGTPEQILMVVGRCLLVLGIRVGIFAVVLGLGDLLYQRFTYRKRMRMTKQEVKREQKESEGDPQHKSERQRLHREILEHQMLESVAKADCVVINPTQIAVALRYDAETMDAPKVMARGRNLLASKIKAIARRHGVPIIRDVPLARALVELELDDEVQPELYEAVAEVLRFVYHLAGDEAE
ncbi:MAG: EscU/YscU/HrcU family type III secretion system export apparatus switch protein [Deltaproteobacteria bacterium]|nr:EscU/YscU/HrcU family type III secretion system export apparatus switch protein [Deltaproteobacteria bacterium]